MIDVTNSGVNFLVSHLWWCALAGALLLALRHAALREKELGRFSGQWRSPWLFLGRDIARMARRRAAIRSSKIASGEARPSDIETERLLIEAGLSSEDARERYLLFREGALFVSIVCSVLALVQYDPLTAAPLVALFAGMALLGPRWWLASVRAERRRGLELEVPFVFEMLTVGCRAGAEPLRILCDLTDTMESTCKDRPVAVELRRAQWCARVGGTWQEGLKVASDRLAHAELARCFDSLRELLDDTSSPHETLQTIANDAYNGSMRRLERRGVVLLFVICGAGILSIVGTLLVWQFRFL